MKQLPLCLALVLLLSACSHAALQNTSDTADTPVEVTDCGEYIDRHGEITGAEARDQFLSAVESGSPADIRIIQYTIEGDPVTIDVSFDGKTFTSTQDTTQDQFGPQQVTTAEWDHLLSSELVADTYGDGSPRTVRTTWFLSPVPQKEIDANPLAEYDSLYLFDRTDTLR